MFINKQPLRIVIYTSVLLWSGFAVLRVCYYTCIGAQQFKVLMFSYHSYILAWSFFQCLGIACTFPTLQFLQASILLSVSLVCLCTYSFFFTSTCTTDNQHKQTCNINTFLSLFHTHSGVSKGMSAIILYCIYFNTVINYYCYCKCTIQLVFIAHLKCSLFIYLAFKTYWSIDDRRTGHRHPTFFP